MDYSAFKDYIAENIKEFLSDKYADSQVTIQSVVKNNETLDAITITSPDTNVSPTIYLNSYFEQYENGKSMDAILESIAAVREEHEVDKAFDVSKITEYDEVKDKIYCKLVGVENNEKMLQERPYTLVGDDLAATYHVSLSEDANCSMSVPITNQLMETYGLSPKQLYLLAIQNMPTLSPSTFKGMNEVMAEMMRPQMIDDFGGDKEAAEEMLKSMIPPEDKMFVLTNVAKLNGASCMLDTTIMDSIKERVGEFFILPSSIHEVLVVPKDAGMELSELEAMVKEVNATQVAPQDRLSDHVYAYDADAKEIYRADLEDEHRAKVDEMSQSNTRKASGR